MQRSLTDTVTHVREGSDAILPVPVKLRRATPIFPPVLNSGICAGRNCRQHGAAHRDSEANADNARQASQLAQSASDTARTAEK